ncbi:MAG: spore coat protein U domain-containing protein [Acidobacteria bacterium]|nr:spore coat protein U domain-containing protein [Acidobacteriota bacterium]
MSATVRPCACAALIVLAWAARAEASCTISTNAVAFGTYDVFAVSDLDSTGEIIYRCGKDKNIRISIDKGGAATFAERRMLNGSELLNYNLYLDAARTTIWGDGTEGTQTYFNADPPNNQYVTLTVYGRVPFGQDVAAGAYSNSVTARIDF